MASITTSPAQLPIHSPMQQPPDYTILMFLLVIGFFAFCCLSCGLLGHLVATRRRYKKMAKRRGVGLTGPPKRSFAPYQILGLTVLFGPVALIMLSLMSENMEYAAYLSVGAVWWYAFFWAFGVPLVMIYAHFSQMRVWKKMLIARGIYDPDDSSEPEPYPIDYEHLERLATDE